MRTLDREAKWKRRGRAEKLYIPEAQGSAPWTLRIQVLLEVCLLWERDEEPSRLWRGFC